MLRRVDKKSEIPLLINRYLGINPNNFDIIIQSNDTFFIYKDAVANCEDFYIVAPVEFGKDETGYVYSMDNFKIYKFSCKDLHTYKIYGDNKYIIPVKNNANINLMFDSASGRISNFKDNKLSLEEEICLTLRVPESGNIWLDDKIRKSNMINITR